MRELCPLIYASRWCLTSYSYNRKSFFRISLASKHEQLDKRRFKHLFRNPASLGIRDAVYFVAYLFAA